MFTQVLFNNISISFHNGLLGLVNPKIELNHFRLNINWHRLCFSLRKINMKSNLFSLKLFCTQKKRKTIVSDLTQSIQLTMTYLANSSVTTIIPEKLKRNSRTEIFSTIFRLFSPVVSPQCQTVWGSFRELIPTPGILQMFKCPILFILLWCWRSWRNQQKIWTEVVRPGEAGPLSQFNGWARGKRLC